MKEITYIAALIIQAKRENQDEHLRQEYEREDILEMDKWIKQMQEEAAAEDQPEILGDTYGSRGGGAGHEEERQGRLRNPSV